VSIEATKTLHAQVRSLLNYLKPSRATVKDHTVTWNTEFVFETNISLGRDNILNPCELTISIKQETNEGKTSEKIGSVVLNLSEFAGERMVTKKLLLRDSNVNSILRISLDMKLLKGDPSFLV
jgi:hypothetical protein